MQEQDKIVQLQQVFRQSELFELILTMQRLDGESAEAAGGVDAPATGSTARDDGESSRREGAWQPRRLAELQFPKPMLQKFSRKDDVESYLDVFERVGAQQKWPKETWATQLAGLLSSDAYSSLAPTSAKDYDQVKELQF